MAEEQNITPWEVSSAKINEEIDYEKVIRQFGCEHFTEEMRRKYGLDHHFFKRGIVFAHRDLGVILEHARKGGEIYLYTGRGPSSKSMHLGHSVPFLLCKSLQDTFGCKLVIQMTDDEKFIWKDITLEQAVQYGIENSKDIAAFGFDPKKTLIFSNVKYSHNFVGNTLKIEKTISLKDYNKVFGFTEASKVGQICFPSKQMSPCFPTSFPTFLDSNALCLIPASIDQDPYFRLARDIASNLKCPKPASIYTYFLPALQGVGEKMSASDNASSIYLNDSAEEIARKIKKYAFSGGRQTVEEHRREGADLSVDVAFHYLRFFLEDDAELERYGREYAAGKILSGEMKSICAEVVQKFVLEFQKRRASITDELMAEFFSDTKK